MPSVVFLRAVNVGGTNRCQPAQIAKELAKLDVVNIGAVGTFVVRQNVSESALRAAIANPILVAEVIDRLNDEQTDVREAAREALRKLARGEDFGPDSQAEPDPPPNTR